MLDHPGTSNPLAEFHPFGKAYRENPHAFYPALLAQSPGAFIIEDRPAAFVATYAHVRSVLADFKKFSSVKPPGIPGMERIDFFNSFPVMNYSDPPQHTRLRRIVSGAFAPTRITAIAARARELTDELLGALGDRPSFEAIKELTFPFTKRLLLNSFMGVPQEEEEVFMDYLRAVPLLDKIPTGGSKPKEFLDAWEAGNRYCELALDRARNSGTDNLVRVIAEASDGGKLSNDEMMAMMVVLFTGGLTTVAATAGAAIANLARYPDIAERIRKEPALAERHLEETLRLDPAVSLVLRFAAADIEFNGLPLEKATPVYVMIAAACHDPAAFPDPYRFDIDRPNNREHMAFGAGMHTCIGNVITRAVLPALIVEIANRFPRLRLTDPNSKLEYDSSNPRARHLARVPLTV